MIKNKMVKEKNTAHANYTFPEMAHITWSNPTSLQQTKIEKHSTAQTKSKCNGRKGLTKNII